MSIAESRPRFSLEEASHIAEQLFGISGAVHALPSDRDQNFLIRGAEGRAWVLKIAHAGENRVELEAQNIAMSKLSTQLPACSFPDILSTITGESIVSVPGIDGASHLVRLLTYLPGATLADANPQSPSLLEDLGRFLGEMDTILTALEHPGFRRELNWDLQNAPKVIRTLINLIKDEKRSRLVSFFLERFENDARHIVQSLPRSVIHNDANDYNVLINAPQARDRKVAGIIDFGDMVYSFTVGELAIASAYVMLGKDDPLAAAACVTRGYHKTHPLKEAEIEALYTLIIMRLCTSVIMSAYQRTLEPDNDYLTISEKPAWALLHRLKDIHPRLAHYVFRTACGLNPCPNSESVIEWLKENAVAFKPVIAFDLNTSRNVIFDLRVGSLENSDVEMTDVEKFTQRMFARMKAENAVVGIGRYNEARRCYSTDEFRDKNSNLWRTVHLGIDLFMEPGSSIYAPINGIVHSFNDNATRFDYGPTIILEHRPAGCPTFYTLYGHLSPSSLEGLSPGIPVKKGQKIATLGRYPENGDWPPHLHFQIITDMLGEEGTFPGVAASRDRAVWLSLCPDPNLILGIPVSEMQKTALSTTKLLEARSDLIGPSLSLSYHEPLHIVRGGGQYLYDDTGKAYLDAVNNVPHVGHCHPRVVEAGRQQMAVLNTNTRYLHDNLVTYARRLTATLPVPLSVCFIVNSGSEANDLALRLARTFTGQKDTIVVDGAYHGNLSSLIEISPYKFDGPGGEGAPSHVHKVTMPDPYRGPYKTGDPSAGSCYAQHVRDAIGVIKGTGRWASAFIVEPLLGCGGQIVPPDGYLREAFQSIREAGGVCIADEVQIGFGRVGSHFWGFETQDVVPDIVTMGKPIGNGHPLGAVVTTPEIAAAFDNGMEYFNTYGGNPVSCAIGLAVLDVIEEEKLQNNALKVGNVLKAGLLRLKDRYPLIGDVRGRGLYLGVELVLSRETLEPAIEQADYVIERMKEEGILVSTDGPFHNVLKIKPPMVFTKDNADFLVQTLERILAEDFVRIK